MPGVRDGQLRVQRGTDSPPWALQLFDDDLGLWLTLAQADEETEMVRAGIAVLRGPYVVDFSDIPHEGDTLTLWTPEVGDVLLRLFVDQQTVDIWDYGRLFIGQNVDGTTLPPSNVIASSVDGAAPSFAFTGLDNLQTAVGQAQSYGPGATQVGSTAYIFHGTDPVQIQLAQLGANPDPSQGHVELYTLVARAVAT